MVCKYLEVRKTNLLTEIFFKTFVFLVSEEARNIYILKDLFSLSFSDARYILQLNYSNSFLHPTFLLFPSNGGRWGSGGKASDVRRGCGREGPEIKNSVSCGPRARLGGNRPKQSELDWCRNGFFF